MCKIPALAFCCIALSASMLTLQWGSSTQLESAGESESAGGQMLGKCCSKGCWSI